MFELPSWSVPADVRLKPRLLRHALPFIELADEAGVDIDAIFAEMGISRRALRNPTTEIPYYQLHWMIEQLAAQCGDPEIGLRAAERMLLARSEFLGNVIRHVIEMSTDLLTVAQLLAHFGTYVCRNMSITLEVGERYVTSTCIPYLEPPPELHDCVAGAFCALLETLAGAGLRPVEVRLPRPCPTTRERYEKFFGAPVVFDAPHFQMVYALDALRKPMKEDAPLHPASPVAALTARAGNALAVQIRTHLLARLAEGVPLLPSVARKLGLSARTLRRRLAEVRSSYAELVDEARRERALSLAARAELDVGRLAELTGFTDASAFARAFRRWTGQRPREYMQRVRGGRAESTTPLDRPSL
ncbi:MAG: AraC family transcriptional regulator ligand-binding domain-containing protein [Polyangiales bacterium]